MGKEHEKIVKEQFKKQAKGFANASLTLNRENLLTWILDNLDLKNDMRVLDVAGGTGILSRAIAPFVQHVTSVDISPDMIREGIKQTEQKGISNITFQLANAKTLPFKQGSFDLVISRLGFHHFAHPKKILQEMSRMCTYRGTVGVIDMMSREDEALSRLYNYYERLRDSSHVHALRKSQFTSLFESVGLEIKHIDVIDVPVQLQSWLALTKLDDYAREKILRDINTEMDTGKIITGLFPYMDNGEVMFKQKWIQLLGQKNR